MTYTVRVELKTASGTTEIIERVAPSVWDMPDIPTYGPESKGDLDVARDIANQLFQEYTEVLINGEGSVELREKLFAATVAERQQNYEPVQSYKIINPNQVASVEILIRDEYFGYENIH